MSFLRSEVVSLRRTSTAARLLFLSAFLAPGARADESDSGQELKPIIVRAEKQPALEQRTPIAMSVYGDAFLETTGVSDVKSLATIAPDLNYAQVQTVVPVLTIRGISSRDTTEIGDPSVVVVTDGSSDNRPYALSGTLYDLDHISVLRRAARRPVWAQRGGRHR
ncbi:hypothetical protein AWB66_05994 [Caballeronia telluris]|uniref:TonB-dependent siderophore receptor n=2 Tax=Caballeronia telluris TaxID=326475 RepID=A0A158KEF7_9BURK|nr:hypothetical protein AWB66_05994 [Caballeronia telluris]